LQVAKRLIEVVEEKGLNEEEFGSLFKYIELFTPVSVATS
jgi:hypothetical protein